LFADKWREAPSLCLMIRQSVTPRGPMDQRIMPGVDDIEGASRVRTEDVILPTKRPNECW